VVAFDNVGVAATTGTTPNTIEAMAHGAIAFIEAMSSRRVDLLGFSIGSFVAQEIALIRPDLLRRVVLASPRRRVRRDARLGAGGDRAVGQPEPSPQGYLASSSPHDDESRGRPAGRRAHLRDGRPTATRRRRGRRARRSTTPSARGASRTTRCSSASPRSSCRCSSPTATATR
jgi:pimeloyl-ACP methyl ester carboxylesterase